jgi:hypothetical protein
MTLSASDAWWDYEQRLGSFLAAMRDREALVLDIGGASYVQFLSWGDHGIHGEVSAPADEETSRRLLDLGWQPPALDRKGRVVSGSGNFFVDVPSAEAHGLAAMTVAVLRDKWRLPGPHVVVAEKVNDAGGPSVEDLTVNAQ